MSNPVRTACPIKLSVIIPVGPYEKEFGSLVDSLSVLPAEEVELIIVTCIGCESLVDTDLVNEKLKDFTLHWHQSDKGRAQQMNLGAAKASGEFLWFVHLDSQFERTAFDTLLTAIEQQPQALHYFQLAWQKPSPAYMAINAAGANLRSKLFGTPFGDQGFCLAKSIFDQVGCYSEMDAYGEDHLLTWQVRQQGYPLNQLKAVLWTSPRKYQQIGWLKLTCLYQWLWIKQAIPEWLKLLSKNH